MGSKSTVMSFNDGMCMPAYGTGYTAKITPMFSLKE